jgi:hypothetical protein
MKNLISIPGTLAVTTIIAGLVLGGLAMIVSATDQSFPNPHYFTVEPR